MQDYSENSLHEMTCKSSNIHSPVLKVYKIYGLRDPLRAKLVPRVYIFSECKRSKNSFHYYYKQSNLLDVFASIRFRKVAFIELWIDTHRSGDFSINWHVLSLKNA